MPDGPRFAVRPVGYSRRSVDRFVANTADTQARLEAEIVRLRG